MDENIREVKLAELDAQEITISFVCPPGRNYDLSVAYSFEELYPPPYIERVILKQEGKTVVDHKIDSRSTPTRTLAEGGNWGDALTQAGGFKAMEPYLKEGKEVEITLQFSDLPKGRSLWLTWLTSQWHKNSKFRWRVQ